MPSPSTLNRQARGLIFDFALGSAIAVLLPIPYTLWLKPIVLAVLLVLLVKGMMRLWQGHQPDVIAKLWLLLGLAGAVLLGGLAGLGGIVLGSAVPWLAGLAPGFAVFAFFWGVGQALNHYYLSGLPEF
jgi:hypothetical protein